MKKIKLAGCVILNDEGGILLLHRNTDRFQHWELPGGKVDPGEAIDQTAVREVKEELGVEVRLVKHLGGSKFSDKNGEFHYSWFLAKIVAGSVSVRELETFDGLKYFDLESLKDESLSGNMQVLLPKLLNGEVKL